MWFQPVPQGDMAADLQVQRYEGQRVLTWWQGYSGAGVGAGEDVIENSSYRQIAVVHAANGLSADLHEFRLTPQGTALITAYYPVYWNATDVHMSSPPDRARLGGPGDRHQDRAAAVPVGQPRPRPADRHATRPP